MIPCNFRGISILGMAESSIIVFVFIFIFCKAFSFIIQHFVDCANHFVRYKLRYKVLFENVLFSKLISRKR